MYSDRVSAYHPRLVDATLTRLLHDHPAVSIVGPRATGKTTTARQHTRDLVRLDRPREAAAYQADPDVALRMLGEPALLDEWQQVPTVLGAVKRAVDDDPRPGRFVLTGSVRAELDVATWPGTGRLIRLPMWPMTVGEIDAGVAATVDATLLDRWARADFETSALPRLDLGDYLHRIAAGGFPDVVLGRGEVARGDWLDSYADQIVTRDARELGGLRDPSRFRRYLEASTLNTAGLPTDITMAQAVGVDRRTIAGYETLLANLLLLDLVPPWFTNRLSRMSKSPKRFLCDTGLAMSVLRMDEAGVLRDGDLLGRLLETFVAAQLRPLLGVSSSRPRLYHLRENSGAHEIDLILEYAAGRVVAIEVKATATPSLAHATHLRWLGERIGDRWIGGVVLHTGLVATTLADGIHALPISALWTSRLT